MTTPGANETRVTRVLIVDDHRVVAEGLAALLDESPGLAVVGLAGVAEEAEALAREQAPDVVLLDVELPFESGFDVARRLHEVRPEARIVFLSTYCNPEYVLRALGLGARGYLLKHESGAVIAAAVLEVAGGREAYSKEIRHIGACLRRLHAPLKAGGVDLSRRERRVALELARGASLAECSDKLGIAQGTVRTLWARAQAKMGLHALPRRLLTSWPED